MDTKCDGNIPTSLEKVWEDQHEEPNVEKIMKQLADNQKLKQYFVVLEDKLYHKKQMAENQFHYRLYIPQSLVQEILKGAIQCKFHFYSASIRSHA